MNKDERREEKGRREFILDFSVFHCLIALCLFAEQYLHLEVCVCFY